MGVEANLLSYSSCDTDENNQILRCWTCWVKWKIDLKNSQKPYHDKIGHRLGIEENFHNPINLYRSTTNNTNELLESSSLKSGTTIEAHFQPSY